MMLGNEVEPSPRTLVFAVDLPVSGQAASRESLPLASSWIWIRRVAQSSARVSRSCSDNRLRFGHATHDDAVTRRPRRAGGTMDLQLLGPLVVDESPHSVPRNAIGTRVCAYFGEPKSGAPWRGRSLDTVPQRLAQPVTVEEMAASVRMSASSFHELFEGGHHDEPAA